MFSVHFCREYRSDLTCDYMFPLGIRERNNLVPRFRVTLAQRNGIWERDCNYACNIYACWLQLFIYLFIHLFINFAKRPHKASSITRPREEKRKEKRKLEIQILTEWQYFRNDKKQQWKTELGRTSVAPNTHTLKGLWGVDISETQVVKDLIKVRYWTVNVPEEGC